MQSQTVLIYWPIFYNPKLNSGNQFRESQLKQKKQIIFKNKKSLYN